LTRSVRIEPAKKAQIEEIFGSVQAWFDQKLEEDFGTDVYEVEIVKSNKKSRKSQKESISIDDF